MTQAAPRKIKRFVTGHDAHGKAIFLSKDEPPQFHKNPVLTELWSTSEPVPTITAEEAHEPNDRPLAIVPPSNGTIVRIVDIPPMATRNPNRTVEGKPAGYHRTETIDYGILIEGELHLVLDDDEVVMHPGDVCIQRGTAHAWENRSSSVARIAFVLLDAKFAPELDRLFAGDEDMKRSAEALIGH